MNGVLNAPQPISPETDPPHLLRACFDDYYDNNGFDQKRLGDGVLRENFRQEQGQPQKCDVILTENSPSKMMAYTYRSSYNTEGSEEASSSGVEAVLIDTEGSEESSGVEAVLIEDTKTASSDELEFHNNQGDNSDSLPGTQTSNQNLGSASSKFHEEDEDILDSYARHSIRTGSLLAIGDGDLGDFTVSSISGSGSCDDIFRDDNVLADLATAGGNSQRATDVIREVGVIQNTPHHQQNGIHSPMLRKQGQSERQLQKRFSFRRGSSRINSSGGSDSRRVLLRSLLPRIKLPFNSKGKLKQSHVQPQSLERIERQRSSRSSHI